jgi:hypothetical protein
MHYTLYTIYSNFPYKFSLCSKIDSVKYIHHNTIDVTLQNLIGIHEIEKSDTKQRLTNT